MFDNISPEKNDCIAAITTKPQTIKVGNFSTIPVLIYAVKTGIKKTIAININIADTPPKKPNGL